MSLSLAEIWRYPLKSHGRETVGQALLEVGKCLPYDRRWAVAHEASDATGDHWVPCVHFSRGSKAPGLMAIEATMDEAAGRLTLTHPDLGRLTFDPDTEADRLIEWAAPVMPKDRAASAR
ncbi:MAG: molybdenum cofactor biosysynthesis protein, partial [Rhodobacteraceae bacterium]|nr:molybdenum cofactor biosysynthesis protein [Paracoccaceae bacterium]